VDELEAQRTANEIALCSPAIRTASTNAAKGTSPARSGQPRRHGAHRCDRTGREKTAQLSTARGDHLRIANKRRPSRHMQTEKIETHFSNHPNAAGPRASRIRARHRGAARLEPARDGEPDLKQNANVPHAFCSARITPNQ
jgi:hypothetical protein